MQYIYTFGRGSPRAGWGDHCQHLGYLDNLFVGFYYLRASHSRKGSFRTSVILSRLESIPRKDISLNLCKMATAAVAVPSACRVEPGSYSLLAATLPVAKVDAEVDPAEVVREWLERFQDVLDGGDFEGGLARLFLKEAYWRDQLCLSWNYRESCYAFGCLKRECVDLG
jgi:hypothetical protein